MTVSQTVQPAATASAVSLRRLTVGVCINIVAIAFETIAVATAMPAAARDLDGLPYYAWSFSLFLIGMLFATVVAGRLSDRIGPAKPMLAGMVIFIVGLVIAGTAESMLQLVGGRLVQGLGSGLMNTAVFVLVAQAYDVAQRPRMFTYISTAWVLPSLVGPPVSAWVTEQLSWHWVFLMVIPMVLGGGLLVLPTLRRLIRGYRRPEPDPAAPSAAPLWAAGLVAVGAALLQLAGQRLDWIGLALFAVGVAALILSLPRLMPDCFSRIRGLSAVISSRGLLAGAFVGAEAFVPLMLVEERQLGLFLAGAALTVGSIGWTAGSWLQSQPWFRLRRDRLITLGCVSLAVGLSRDRTRRAAPRTALLAGRRRLGVRRPGDGAGGLEHLAGGDDPVRRCRAGPERFLAEPGRRPRGRPVRRCVGNDLRGASGSRAATGHLRRGDRVDVARRPAGDDRVATDRPGEGRASSAAGW